MTPCVPLSHTTLNALRSEISIPRYDRSSLTGGILHIGVGNFHRAHQATYLDRLFQTGDNLDWGIIGASVQAEDAARREDLIGQDCLSAVVELDPAGYTASICGSMIDFLPIDGSAIVAALVRPEIRIVSLTITEGGYFIDEGTGGFDIGHAGIQADIENPNRPGTVFGILVAALAQRSAAGLPPFTILSCDNIPHNGAVTRQSLLGLAEVTAPHAVDWIADRVQTPNGMVDCITPAAGERERELVEREFGLFDRSPVICEPFRQWVLEDRFSNGRPPLEQVGVEFVTDVAPYELMKLRILNGGHAALAYAGALLGYHYVHDAMRDQLVRAFVDRLIRREIIPTLTPIFGVDFHAYLASVLERFSNPRIGDTIPRLCLDGSNRQPKFILPTVNERLAARESISGLALEVALWCRFCTGTRDDGSPIAVEDEEAERLMENARRADTEPSAFLGMTDIFGSLSSNRTFADSFSSALEKLKNRGAVGALEAYVNGGLQ